MDSPSVNLYIWIERSKLGAVDIATTRSLVVGFVPIAAPLFAVHQRDSTLSQIARPICQFGLAGLIVAARKFTRFLEGRADRYSGRSIWRMRLIQ